MSEIPDYRIQQTRLWVEQVVVRYNFCPFAKRELDSHRVRYIACDSSKQKEVMEQFLDEVHFLDDHDNTETTLFILANGFADFYTYLDMLDMVEQLLAMEGYEGVYQVASFHPDYCFADADFDDAANFTNRSPYPMLHILRETSLEKAIDSHPDVDAIPARNIKQARLLGADVFKAILGKL